MSDAVISVENLGKRYTLRHEVGSGLLRDRIAQALHAPLRWARRKAAPTERKREEFWALHDVNFSIPRGAVVGIVGRNGAGKSTLLKILSRITEPTTGRVRVHGRVASLLEVGTGFHPELSGRENIFLNGAILGMNRAEIRRKFDEIVAFAEVERFLDTPVKHYSSGMYVRLAFAVAAHLEPEILVVDEVLAVGDLQFQQKCLGKMRNIASNAGRTVLFVSHNTAAVAQLCTSGMVLERGALKYAGNVAESLALYAAEAKSDAGQLVDALKILDEHVRVEDLRIGGSAARSVSISSGTNTLEIVLDIALREPRQVSMEVHLREQLGGSLALFSPGHVNPAGSTFSLSAGRHRLRAEIGLPPLHRGRYALDLALTRPGVAYYARGEGICVLNHEGTATPTGVVFDQSAQGAGYFLLPGSFLAEPRNS